MWGFLEGGKEEMALIIGALETVEPDALEIMIRASEPAPAVLAQALAAALRAEKKRRESGGRAEEVEIDLAEITSEALVGFQFAVLAERKVFARRGWTGAAAFCYRLALEALLEHLRSEPA